MENSIATDFRKKFDIEWGVSSNGDHVIGVAGVNDAKFILANGSDFSKCKVNFGITDRKHLTDHTCICFDSKTGFSYTGSESGNVFIWKETKGYYSISSEKKVHQKCIYSIKWIDDCIFTGSGDLSIKISSTTLKELMMIDSQGTVRSVDYYNNLLVYSTKYGNIFKREVNLLESKVGEFQIVMNSHCSREEWGIWMQDDSLYSWGDDDQLIERDFKTHQTVSVYSSSNQQSSEVDTSGLKAGLLGLAAAKLMVIK